MKKEGREKERGESKKKKQRRDDLKQRVRKREK